MYFADKAVIVTNPELSSCRDSDKMIGFIASKSKRAEEGKQPVQQVLLVTRFGEWHEEQQYFVFHVANCKLTCLFSSPARADPERASRNECLSLEDIEELLGIPLIGVIPESPAILTATNLGQPVISLQAQGKNCWTDRCVKNVLSHPHNLTHLQCGSSLHRRREGGVQGHG